MNPRVKSSKARGRRISAARVERWFPGRGSAFVAPPARVFYSTKLRASLHWWKQEKAPGRILESIRKGVKLDFVSAPPTQHRAPLLVQQNDVDWVIKDIAKGDNLGAYSPLVPGGERYLSRARVDTRDNGKRRLVLNFRAVNAACRKLSCRFEQLRDLPTVLRRGEVSFHWGLGSR